MQGARFGDLLAVGARIFWETHCVPLLLAGERVEQFALELRHVDGTKVPVMLSAHVHASGADGRPTVYRIALTDISQRHRVERDLVARNDRLTRSNEEYDTFAHAVAHDLQAPLRGIRQNTEFFLEDTEGTLPAEATVQLDTVVRLTGRMKSMLDDLLAYAQAGQVEVDPRSTDLPEAIAEVVDLLGTAAERASITVPPSTTFTADPGALRQLLLNLLGNAVKYSGDAPAQIAVGVTTLAEARTAGPLPPTVSAAAADTPVLVVADHGIGIDPVHHEQIFRLFRQLDPRADGSGTGLALCRMLCRRHGGDVWLTSEPGAGTTFYVVTAPR